MIKLTAKDKANINILADIYDAWVRGSPRKPHSTINFNRDQDALLNYGFEYGMTRNSMFGTDNTGQLWQVGSYGELSKANTVWYRIDERGLRHKHTPALQWEEFYNLFGEKKDVR